MRLVAFDPQRDWRLLRLLGAATLCVTASPGAAVLGDFVIQGIRGLFEESGDAAGTLLEKAGEAGWEPIRKTLEGRLQARAAEYFDPKPEDWNHDFRRAIVRAVRETLAAQQAAIRGSYPPDLPGTQHVLQILLQRWDEVLERADTDLGLLEGLFPRSASDRDLTLLLDSQVRPTPGSVPTWGHLYDHLLAPSANAAATNGPLVDTLVGTEERLRTTVSGVLQAHLPAAVARILKQEPHRKAWIAFQRVLLGHTRDLTLELARGQTEASAQLQALASLLNSQLEHLESFAERAVGAWERLATQLEASTTRVEARIAEAERTLLRVLESQGEREWGHHGRFLAPRDVDRPPAGEGTGDVVVGQRIKLEQLRRGCFRDRPERFDPLCQAFRRWLPDAIAGQDKVPVFWISGRSGEGKSVLLFQLVARLVNEGRPGKIFLASDGTQIPALLELAGRHPDWAEDPLLVVVDDLFDVPDRPDWALRMEQACALARPPVLLLTCGPTEQAELCDRALSREFIFTFERIPEIDVERELGDWMDWFHRRTGRPADGRVVTRTNPMLVQVLFELCEGVSIRDFAVRFRRRLENLRLFEPIRTCLAVNALYRRASIRLLPGDDAQDALRRLGEEDQRHFVTEPPDALFSRGSMRFGHAHLAFVLLRAWAETEPGQTNRDFAVLWARALAPALEVLHLEPNGRVVGDLLYALQVTPRLHEGKDRLRCVTELYRIHLLTRTRPSDQTLPRWLALTQSLHGLLLTPCPLELALEALATVQPSAEGGPNAESRTFQPSTASWIHRRASSLPEPRRTEARQQALHFLRTHAGLGGTPMAILNLWNWERTDPAVREFCIDWFASHPRHPRAPRLAQTLLRMRGGDPRVRDAAHAWLDAHPELPASDFILIDLLKADPQAPAARTRVRDWTHARPDHPRIHDVLGRWLGLAPDDPAARRTALDWLRRHAASPGAGTVLGALLRSAPGVPEVRKAALTFLASVPEAPAQFTLLTRLVAAHPDDPEVVDLALDRLQAAPRHASASTVLASLVAAAPRNPAVQEAAWEWLRRESDRPRVAQVLAAMIAAYPGDPELRGNALAWLDAGPGSPSVIHVLIALVASAREDPEVRAAVLRHLLHRDHVEHACDLLAPMLAADPSDAEARAWAFDWLKQFPTHPGGAVLLKPLVAGAPGDPAVQQAAFSWMRGFPSAAGIHELLIPLVVRVGVAAQGVREAIIRYLSASPPPGARQHFAAQFRSRHAQAPAETADWLRSGVPDQDARLIRETLGLPDGWPPPGEIIRRIHPPVPPSSYAAAGPEFDAWRELGDAFDSGTGGR